MRNKANSEGRGREGERGERGERECFTFYGTYSIERYNFDFAFRPDRQLAVAGQFRSENYVITHVHVLLQKQTHQNINKH